MLNQRFLSSLVAIFVYASQTYADDNKTCTKTSKINYLSDYTNLYTNIRMCLRVAKSKGITDSDGRIYVSYRAPLKKDENPNELCQCMREYILQGDWWVGAKNLCYVECDTVTLLLIGTPEKRFINAQPVYIDEEPIDGIIEFFGIYSNAQVWNDNCLAETGTSKDGRKSVVWTCKYSGPNLPQPEKLCDYMYAYINGGAVKDILSDTATHTCRVKGNKFYLNLVANED